jgi:Fic family protein
VFLAAIDEEGPLTLPMILRWHQKLFEQTKSEIAGKVRTYPVRISQSKFVPPDPFELDMLLRDFFDGRRAAGKAIHPVMRAALVHLRLVSIHPLGDGNGRVTRIAMNRELRLAGFPLFNIPYLDRRSYYAALERSQMGTNEVPFTRWFAKRYLTQTSHVIAT